MPINDYLLTYVLFVIYPFTLISCV